MLLNAISYLLGLSIIQQLADLPTFWWQCLFLAGMAASCLILFHPALNWIRKNHFYRNTFRFTLFLLLGVSWGCFHASAYLEHRLPESLAGKDFLVTGVIQGIPQSQDSVQRFILKVERYSLKPLENMPARLKLSWYYGKRVNAGDRWQFKVRLKPPHGMQNPGGFDYEGWLYQQGIHGTGYIRKSPDNTKIDTAGPFSIDRLRQSISHHIQQVLKFSDYKGIVTALAVGDRSSIPQQQWQQLIRTGTNHLIAISGLHIGLAAAFAYFILRKILLIFNLQRFPAQHIVLGGGLIAATIYALLAGFSIPTQRALVMLMCLVISVLLRRSTRSIDILSMALIVVLTLDPVAILSAGFWFSFIAVAVIIYVLNGRTIKDKTWFQWGWMQWSITLGLCPLSLLLFQQASVVAPLANLLLVPFVSLIVVPLVLLAIVIMPVWQPLSDYLLHMVHCLLENVWPLLSILSEADFATWNLGVADIKITLLASLGVLLLLAPRGFPIRYLGLFLVIPLIFFPQQRTDPGAFVMDLLDVGQGLAVGIRTRNHTLVFDSGDSFGKHLDSGSAVIVPYLRKYNIKQLDRLVISHGDADHIGGASSLIEAYPYVAIIGQDIEKIISKVNVYQQSLCHIGTKWSWDGVFFEFLHPDTKAVYKAGNNRSCVLKINSAGGSLLITGDIEKKVENLLTKEPLLLDADVLIVPHHGSKTSSTSVFVDAVSPDIALFPVGYRNRYRLPAASVIKRYREAGAVTLSSGHSGAISVEFHPVSGVRILEEYRRSHRKYWHHNSPDLW